MSENNNIKEELNALGFSRRTSKAYRIPEGYFDSLHDETVQRKNRSPYKVPEGYFEKLPNEVVQKLKPQKTTVRRMVLPWVGIAASLLGLIYFFGGSPMPDQNPSELMSSYEELYLEDVIDDFSDEEIAELDQPENLEDWDTEDIDDYVEENIYELNETEFFELIDENI